MQLFQQNCEPVEIKYMWSFDKREHRYYPDFYMKTRGLEGEEEFLVEIKPEAQITKPKPPTKNSQKALKSYKCILQYFLKLNLMMEKLSKKKIA